MNSTIYIPADMRINRAKTYRILKSIIAVVIVLYVCIVIKTITVNKDQRHLRAIVAYLRRKLDISEVISSRNVTSGVRVLQADNNHLISSMPPHYDDFIRALTARADKERYIILAMTDESFIDMAINFYEASLRAHGVDNFLFVGVGRNACVRLSRLLIPCFYYTNDPSAATASYWGRRDFIRKMNIRTDMILEALAANFTVIHTDIDVAFFGNPVQQLKIIGSTL